jgi:hypothetical protein
MMAADHEFAFLLSLDGYEYRFAAGYRVRFEAREVKATAGRPHGVKYSLTLHAREDGASTGSTTRIAPAAGGSSITATSMVSEKSLAMPIGDRSCCSMTFTAKWSGYWRNGA